MLLFHRITRLAIVGLLGLCATPALAQEWQWAHSINPVSTIAAGAYTNASVITASGEIIASHQHSSPIVLGGQTYPTNNQGNYNVAVARYSTTGAVTGVLLESRDGMVSDMALDAQGNLYATGFFTGQLILGATRLTGQGTSDVFIAKWNAAGVLQWARQAPSTRQLYSEPVVRVVADVTGNVTLVSTLSNGDVTFGTQTLTIGSQSEHLLAAQYNATGALNWAYCSSNLNNGTAVGGVGVGPDGSIHIAALSADFTWNGAQIGNGGSEQGLWMKLNADGTLAAHQRYGVPNIIGIPPRLAVDAAGVPYMVFNVTGTAITWDTLTFSLPAGARQGFFVAGLTPSGSPAWVKPGTAPDSGYVTVNHLRAVSGTNGGATRLYLGGFSENQARVQPGVVGYDGLMLPSLTERGIDGFLLATNGTDGAGTWLMPVAESMSMDDVQALGANEAGQLSVGGYFNGDSATFGTTNLLASTPQGQAGYIAKLLQSFNVVTGKVYLDANANAIQDAGEMGVPNLIVEGQPGPEFTSTDAASGTYRLLLPALGTFGVALPNPPRYHNVVNTNAAAVPFSTFGNVATGHDFALQPIPNQQDLEVFLTPINRARPGFALTYRLTAHNVGTVPVAAALQLAVDPLLSFVSATVPGTVSGTTLSVALGTLQPGETRNVDVLYQIAVTAPVNHVLVGTATLNPTAADLTPADNVEVSNLTVTASYDPNDITVNFPTLLLPDVQNAVHPLDYTVRFQNMGNDTAFTVVIRDTLPANMLYLGTLQVLASSHSCTWRLGPGGVLTVRFPNINLPAFSTNTLRSMGFVRFRMMPYTTLAIGDLVTNEADIHFDFNAPVNTNTALTAVVSPTGVTPETASTLSGGAWPNPATGTLHVALDLPTAAPLTVTLTDALGRAVQTKAGAAASGHFQTALDVSGLAPGLYLLRAQAAGRGFSQRVVVR